jgi:aryl-alcohol dehydrogenase-like predicted oxidoreductase
MLDALEQSLARLGVSHVDLWQVHAWDDGTPLEETLSALDHAVASGRARYAGISNYSGWQTARAATSQGAWPGRTPLVSTQVEYSLVERGIEGEVVPAAIDAGMGLLPWSPLGRGVLTGKYRLGARGPGRAGTTAAPVALAEYLSPRRRGIVDAVCRAAEGLDLTPAEVALAWVRDRPGVTAPIVGARTAQQLRTSLAVERVVLPVTIGQALDEVSQPVRMDG